MATQNQIDANRRNAQNSTGPTSPEGKAASSMNALKTGIDAKSELLRFESREDHATLIAEYHDRFQPATPEEPRLTSDSDRYCVRNHRYADLGVRAEKPVLKCVRIRLSQMQDYNSGMVQRGTLKRAARQPAVMAAGAGAHPFDHEYTSAPPSAQDRAGVATESDDVVAMVRTATEVLGIDHVARWMQSKIPSLGNQTPYALIQTEDGRRQVLRVLLKIEHGVY